MSLSARPLHFAAGSRLAIVAVVSAALLSGCVSIGAGGDPPSSLLTLRADEAVASATERSVAGGTPVIIIVPTTPRTLDTIRVPVQVDATSVAYVKQAYWADKPARLFHALLKESLAAKTNRLVLSPEDAKSAGAVTLSGSLMKFGYDAQSGDAVAVYDALLRKKDGSLTNKRFSASVPSISPEAEPLGRALNAAANTISVQVTDWVQSQL